MNRLIILVALIFFVNQVTLIAQIQIGQDIDGQNVGDESGKTAISQNGEYIVVGGRYNDNNGNQSGHVRVFETSGNNWVQIGQDVQGSFENDQLGIDVDMSHDGSIIVAGAPGLVLGSLPGYVRAYQYNGSDWSQIGQDIVGDMNGDLFGASLSLSADGSVLAVNAPLYSNGDEAGKTKVYQYNGSDWSQIGQNLVGLNNNSISSAVLSGDGSVIALSIGNGGVGQVSVYEFSNNTWTQLGADIVGNPDDGFGIGLSLNHDGRKVAIGAVEADVNGQDSGQVKVYSYSNANWNQLGQGVNGDEAGDRNGITVAFNFSGTTLAIGSLINGANGDGSGRVRIFQYLNNKWVQQGQDIFGESSDDWSVLIDISSDNTKMAIGSVRNDGNGNNAGHVRVFDISDILNIETISNDLNITLYPNPANDFINISHTELLLVTIYDTSGKEVFKEEIVGRINVKNLQDGFYTIIISDGFRTSTHRLIKGN